MNASLVCLSTLIIGFPPEALPASVSFRELACGPEPKTCVYKTVGGHDLRLFYFEPGDAKLGELRPAVVWIHGGAWIGGTLDGFMLHARYTAARGAVGFNLEYRLAKPEGPSVGDCLSDCKSALRYIRAHASVLGVDSQRIAVAGDSAGGHLAAALGTIDGFDDPSDNLSISARPDAMILYNPIVDMTESDWIRYAVGGTALADKKSPRPDSMDAIATARSLSPISHVGPGQPPALLMHGLADKVVPSAQASRFAAAMNEAGNRCDLVLLPDTGHAFAVAFWKSPETTVVDTVCQTDRFLTSLGWLKGEPTLITSTPLLWLPLNSHPAAK